MHLSHTPSTKLLPAFAEPFPDKLMYARRFNTIYKNARKDQKVIFKCFSFSIIAKHFLKIYLCTDVMSTSVSPKSNLTPKKLKEAHAEFSQSISE